jgi:hypothetical protein
MYYRKSHKTREKKKLMEELIAYTGRAVAQAVIRWLPTAEARVQTRV